MLGLDKSLEKCGAGFEKGLEEGVCLVAKVLLEYVADDDDNDKDV